MTQRTPTNQSKTFQTKRYETIPYQTIPRQTIPRLTMTELKELVIAASSALANLDVNRLEELALSCEALNRDMETFSPGFSPDERRELADQATRATADMAVFARVLDATRSNLKVMRRLGQLRAERLEYKLEYKEDLVTSSPEILTKGSARGID